MASDASHPGEEQVKVRRKRKEREARRTASALDVQTLTSAGHQALEDGRTEDALSWFKDALRDAGQVNLLTVYNASV